jgi:hypothetical protein
MQTYQQESGMGFVPVMWVFWGASFVFMVGVSILAARLTRYEGVQIILADSSSHVKSEQDAIAARVSKIRPLRLTSLGLAGVMTAFVVGYYLLDLAHRFGL